MKRVVLLAGVALALAACGPEVRKSEAAEPGDGQLRTIARLDCPQSQGELKLVSAAPDGQTCAYKSDTAEVELRLVALGGGDAKAVLDPIEAQLKGIVPAPVRDVGVGATGTDVDVDAPDNEAADDNAGKAEINFPGLHIKADEGGADIRLGNIRIDADENGGAEIKVGGQTTVNANDGGAEIRTGSTVGEVRATYILASEKPQNGYHVAGYEARGPAAGPIVVATVKAREGDYHQRDLFDDLKDLVERQVGE